ncbi:MAG: pyruvate kinase [Gemmatimonadetes bacterium]|jgi:pyruvate kinase|nr:pyruvate kinase [Gemmatimonadota bacterium]
MLRTKIVCTLGPASSAPDTVLAMVRGGMDMARINMSHGSHEEHRAAIEAVRRASGAVDRPVAVLVDLAGPKIRVGDLPEPVELAVGDTVVMAPEASARSGELPTTYAALAEEIEAGQAVLLDDGLLELRCVGTDGDRTRLEVVRGGTLKSRKGINLPAANVRAPSLTEKDLDDLDFALECGVEYIGLSFVRSPADVTDLKERVDKRALVVAKIEKVQALQAIEEILPETDAVMVARGDLGVELPFERVPLAQKRIVQLANYHGRPVITATQMLESMIEHPRPTRAEASDVANAILDGTDAVMLSGETAAGAYPLQALDALVRIAREIERSGVLEHGPRYITRLGPRARGGATAREHAVAVATVDAVRQVEAPAILVITRSGFTARLVTSYRPPVPVYVVTTDAETYLQLTAVWGVHPVLASAERVTYDALMAVGRQAILNDGVGDPGASVPVTSGYPFHTSGTTNTMRLERL